ncbi:MAG TPA: polysaccharide biosynthesis tyrosine autokinase [Candidatus Didemnitutus sp.]|nr:polysaccharide biosynthesis tyrosine autokinase [Candidatus Didemnitutus sp.]
MASPSSPAPESATLNDFVGMLRLRKTLIFLVLGLVIATTAGVTALLPKWYLATAKIRVEKPESEMKLFQSQNNTYYDPYFIQDQFEIIQSEKIIYPVIDDLDLTNVLGREFNDGRPIPKPIAYKNFIIDRMLRVESRRATSLIEINVYAREPKLAADIANDIARVYSQDRINLAMSDQSEGLTKLRGELVKQEQTVVDQRDRVEKLRKELDISGVDLNQRYSDMEIETLRQMQNSLIALRVDAIGRKTRWERFKSIPPEERRNLVNTELISDTNIQNLLQAYLVSEQNVTKLRGRLGANHPDLVAAVEASEKIQQQLDSQLRGYENSLEMAYKEAESRVTELERQLGQAKVEQILSARERMRPFEEAATKLEDEQRLLTTLKLTLRQREIDFTVPKKTIEILNIAEPPQFASRPNWALNLIFAIAFGGILGVGAAVLVEYFDTSFRNVADVETKLNLPVLGVIPQSREPAEFHDSAAAEGEPFRVLQTNLNLALRAGQSTALAIFSAGPGEGKSTTLRQLALTMVAAGEKVLLIDSDVRRPTQHRLAGVAREPGLTDVLLNKISWTQAVRRDPAHGLDLLPAGASAGVTLSLLYVNKLRELVTEFRGQYDKVLFDSPPIIGVSDASVLASIVDGTVLLIQHRRNPASMVLRAQQIIAGLKAPIIGVILSQVPTGTGEDYGYYTNNYSYYTSESGAGSDDKASRRGPEKIELTEKSGRRRSE